METSLLSKIKALHFSICALAGATCVPRMRNTRAPHWLSFFLLISIACLTGPAAAVTVIYEQQIAVVEYYNTFLDHYFLTATPVEMDAIEHGSAGAGWSRTGLSFVAYPATPLPFEVCPGDCGRPVSRFHGTPGLGPNSHFYTAELPEAEALMLPGSGWTFERTEFSIALPDANGHCAASQVPVHRFYNNRWMFNDSNHRYVTDQGERDRMRARGWIDEGVHFCAYGATQVPIKSFLISIDLDNKILPSPQCEDESINLGPCMALNNLPVPSAMLSLAPTFAMPIDFFNVTGMQSSFVHVENLSTAADESRDVFVQGGGSLLGIHVDTRQRGAAAFSSVNPLYQFHTTIEPGRFDDRFFPWMRYESDVQLAVRFTLNVKTVNLRGTGSAAFGHPTLEFIDQRSGRHLYFTVQTYGTVAFGDFVAPDVVTRKVIVSTTFRGDSPYLRSFGLPPLPTPSGFVSPNFWGWGGPFEFRMDRREFQRVVDAARTVDPALSAAPEDYLMDAFHFNNEVYGDGEIGINLDGFTLELLRR